MNLDNTVTKNLNILVSLEENDNLVINNNELIIDNENDFQEVKINELLYCIVTTLFFSLQHNCRLNVKDYLLTNIRQSITNIFTNKILIRHLDNDNYFMQFFNEIELNHSKQVIRYQNIFNRFLYRIYDNYDSVLNNVIHYSREIIRTQELINGQPIHESEEENEEDISSESEMGNESESSEEENNNTDKED